MSNHATLPPTPITDSRQQARLLGTPQVTALRPITEAITSRFGDTATTQCTQQSRRLHLRRSGNHATNHANHAAGNHARSPLYKRGRVSPDLANHSTPMRLTMNDLDPALAEILRVSAEKRIAEQIAAAARAREARQQTRAEFTASRTAGLRNRYAAKQARGRLAQHHQQQKGQAQ